MQTGEQFIINSDYKPLPNIPAYIFDDIMSEEGNYFVGGFVRDFIVGKTYNFDIDIAVSDISGFLNRLKKRYKAHLVELDRDFGVYRVFLKGMDYYLDVAKLQGNDIFEDLSRRDFTINALALRYEKGRCFLIDPFNGKTDIERGVIKAVSRKNLTEDPLRLLRAFRFQSQLGFKIDAETQKFIEELSFLINQVAKERVKAEISKILRGSNSSSIFRQMEGSILKQIFPFFESFRNFYGGERHSYDLFEHSFKTLENIEDFLKNGFPLDFDKSILTEELEWEFSISSALKMAALLHDVGKILTKDIINNKITFYEHAKKGAKYLTYFLMENKFSSRSVKLITNIVEYHCFLLNIIQSNGVNSVLSPKAYLKINHIFGTYSPLLFVLSIADNMAKNGDGDSYVEAVKGLYNDYLAYHMKERNLKKPILNGKDVIRILNIEEGPRVGAIIKDIREKELAGLFKDRASAEDYIKEKYGQKT